MGLNIVKRWNELIRLLSVKYLMNMKFRNKRNGENSNWKKRKKLEKDDEQFQSGGYLRCALA